MAVSFDLKGLVIKQFNTNQQKGVTVMKKNIVIHCLVLLMLIVTFFACESKPKQESAGEYLDDSVITTEVKSLLAADDFHSRSVSKPLRVPFN